jgi:hypothetical protein
VAALAVDMDRSGPPLHVSLAVNALHDLVLTLKSPLQSSGSGR